MFNPINKTAASNFKERGSQGSLSVPVSYTDATGQRKRGTWDAAMKAKRETHAMKDNDLFQKSLSARRGEGSTSIRTAASDSAKGWLGR